MRNTFRLAATAALVAAPLAAQSNAVATRVGAVRDGIVRMQFPARRSVCGDGTSSVWIRGDRNRWTDNRPDYVCGGPVVVRVGRADGQTISVRKSIDARVSSAADVDLGVVSPDEAGRYLITLAHDLGGKNAEEAISAAGFADASDLSREFGALIRDANAPVSSRENAIFWFGESGASTADLIALDGDLKSESLRRQFTFVLSQRDDDRSMRKLMEIARTDRDVDVRKQAMFWLGQSKDPAAVKFFREILTP
jgi:hypothetical protein